MNNFNLETDLERINYKEVGIQWSAKRWRIYDTYKGTEKGKRNIKTESSLTWN
jgi:hypothetical protein